MRARRARTGACESMGGLPTYRNRSSWELEGVRRGGASSATVECQPFLDSSRRSPARVDSADPGRRSASRGSSRPVVTSSSQSRSASYCGVRAARWPGSAATAAGHRARAGSAAVGAGPCGSLSRRHSASNCPRQAAPAQLPPPTPHRHHSHSLGVRANTPLAGTAGCVPGPALAGEKEPRASWSRFLQPGTGRARPSLTHPTPPSPHISTRTLTLRPSPTPLSE